MKAKVIINDLNQAREIVKQFDEKISAIYKHLDDDINRDKFESIQAHLLHAQPEQTKETVETILSELNDEEHHKFNRSVTRLQRQWKHKCSMDILIPYNVIGFHHRDVNVFVKQNININLNVNKQNA